jgi:hypothetical protein
VPCRGCTSADSEPKAGKDVKQSLLGTVERRGGKQQ